VARRCSHYKPSVTLPRLAQARADSGGTGVNNGTGSGGQLARPILLQLLYARLQLCVTKPSVGHVATLKAHPILQLRGAAARSREHAVLQYRLYAVALVCGARTSVVHRGERGSRGVAREQVAGEARGKATRRRIGSHRVVELLGAHRGDAAGTAVVVQHDVVGGDGLALVRAGADGEHREGAVPLVQELAGLVYALALRVEEGVGARLTVEEGLVSSAKRGQAKGVHQVRVAPGGAKASKLVAAMHKRMGRAHAGEEGVHRSA
jgi:hypothetical protein